MKKLNLALALASGLVGGVASRYIAPQTVEAQSPAPPTAEVRARSFLLVNDKGAGGGQLGGETGRKPPLSLFRSPGPRIWEAQTPPLPRSRGPLTSDAAWT